MVKTNATYSIDADLRVRASNTWENVSGVVNSLLKDALEQKTKETKNDTKLQPKQQIKQLKLKVAELTAENDKLHQKLNKFRGKVPERFQDLDIFKTDDKSEYVEVE